jgi:hypothetical protein
MKATMSILLLALAVNVSLRGQALKRPISAQGRVIAVQGRAGEPKIQDPGSVASAVEMWIAHIDRWPEGYKPTLGNTILIEYQFARGNEGVSEKELDRSAWNFELWETAGEEKKSCMAWIVPDESFRPTAQAKAESVPIASELPCFLLKKRPAPLPSSPTTR